MTRDRVTANLPARDMSATQAFYTRLGFACVYRDDGWMILKRGPFEVEFFHHPDLDPTSSWFSACLRCADIAALFAEFAAAGLNDDPGALPRLTAPEPAHGPVPAMFALIDPNGSLIRCLQEAR